MPERILRDITDSDAYNAVSPAARDLFVRFINKADDFGLYFADARRLRPLLYPLILDQVREADLQRWTAECAKAGLVRLYKAEDRQYLQVSKWRQRLRNLKPKFPPPPWGVSDDNGEPTDRQLSDICTADAVQPLTDTDTDTDTKTKTKTKPPPAPRGGEGPEFLELIPESLRTQAFLAAWAAWLKFRRERKPTYTATAAERALPKLAEEGEAAAIERIDRSIVNGWQGLFFSGEQPVGGRNGQSKHAKHLADLDDAMKELEASR